jgi:hypothetical protein
MALKYVMLDSDRLQDLMIVFPGIIGHDEMARRFPEFKVVSAGTIDVDPRDLKAVGHSHSLGVSSRPEDTDILKVYSKCL